MRKRVNMVITFWIVFALVRMMLVMLVAVEKIWVSDGNEGRYVGVGGDANVASSLQARINRPGKGNNADLETTCEFGC